MDPISITSLNGVVYRIPCKDCDLVYVGHSELQSDSISPDRASALAEHEWMITALTGRMQLLEMNQSHWTKRCLLAFLHISKVKSLNRERDPLPLATHELNSSQ